MEASGSQGTRNCTGCGRAISWDANVCPYCGHDYRVQMMAPAQGSLGMSEGMKIVLYLLSFFIPIIGIIVGIIYYTKPDHESKEFGKMCLILGIVGFMIGLVCNFAFLL